MQFGTVNVNYILTFKLAENVGWPVLASKTSPTSLPRYIDPQRKINNEFALLDDWPYYVPDL